MVSTLHNVYRFKIHSKVKNFQIFYHENKIRTTSSFDKSFQRIKLLNDIILKITNAIDSNATTLIYVA